MLGKLYKDGQLTVWGHRFEWSFSSREWMEEKHKLNWLLDIGEYKKVYQGLAFWDRDKAVRYDPFLVRIKMLADLWVERDALWAEIAKYRKAKR